MACRSCPVDKPGLGSLRNSAAWSALPSPSPTTSWTPKEGCAHLGPHEVGQDALDLGPQLRTDGLNQIDSAFQNAGRLLATAAGPATSHSRFPSPGVVRDRGHAELLLHRLRSQAFLPCRGDDVGALFGRILLPSLPCLLGHHGLRG